MTGAKSAIKRDVVREKIVKDYGEKYELLMVLHINDTVSVVNDDGERIFYRVQKLGASRNEMTLRLNIAATIKKKHEEISIVINTKNFEKHKVCFHHINAIGHLVND